MKLTMRSITRPILPSPAVPGATAAGRGVGRCGEVHRDAATGVIDYVVEPCGSLVARSGNSHGNLCDLPTTGHGRRRTPAPRARRADRLAREGIGWAPAPQL